VCHEAEQVDYEIVLHAEELRLPITGGVMGMEGYFADKIVPEMSEFEVEDYSEVVEDEYVEGRDYLLPRNEENVEPTGYDEELGMVARDVMGERDEDDWWNAYIATAEATMCPVIETQGANFAGNTDIKARKDKVNEETDSNDGWQVVKRKQSKPKKGTKAKTGEEGIMGEVNLSKSGEKQVKKEQVKKVNLSKCEEKRERDDVRMLTKYQQQQGPNPTQRGYHIGDDVGVIQEVKPSGRGSHEVNLTADVEEYLNRPEREKGPVLNKRPRNLNRESIAEFGAREEVIPEQETERVKAMEGGAIYTTRAEECAHLS